MTTPGSSAWPAGIPARTAHASTRQGLLPTRTIRADEDTDPVCWFVGAHGGAGSTTLGYAVAGAADGGRYWPVREDGGTRVVLVARTHASGLRAAQTAARHWAEGALPQSVHLLGLAVIADAPGRLPRPLRELLHLISGGLPQVWDLPWIEALRLGDRIPLPPAYTALAADLHRLTGDSHA
jgi:hypothetical protein